MGADPTLPAPPTCFPQSAALECSFGQEEIFEAVWVNESTVRCNQVVVSGVAPVGGRGRLAQFQMLHCLLLILLSSSFWVPPPILTSPALISMTSPPRTETWTPSIPFMLSPVLLQLHTTQKSQVFPLSLQLKGRPARFLDSPDPMTGQSPRLPHMGTGDSATMGVLSLGGLIPVLTT